MRRLLALAAALSLAAIACNDIALYDGPEREGDDPGECEDGADNDFDGAYDCDDSDCAGAPACADDDDAADDDDDDAVGDDDDSAAFDGLIEGTIELDGAIVLDSSPPHGVGIGLFLDEDFSPLGPTGDPVGGITMDDVAGFPVNFSVPYISGESVWIAAFVDEDGSGLEEANTGDVVGFSAAIVPVPSTGVTVTLILEVP